MERARCRDSCLYFLQKYGKINDALRGTIRWEPWPHLIYLLDILARHRLIIILKPKQIGVTWLIQGDNLHKALFRSGANIVTLSKGQEEASEELDYARFIHRNLPNFLRLPMGQDQAGLIGFPSISSKMRALPSTEASGVGFGAATRVVSDEFEYHKFAKENFAEIQPMISGGGQWVIMSSADGAKADTKFKEVFKKADKGESDFFPVFLPYNVRPERTEEWWEGVCERENLAPYERACRYPRTKEEALGVIDIINFFDTESLRGMLRDCTLAPVEVRHNGLVKIWKPAIVGRLYFSGIDISDGRYNFTAMPIMDWQTNEVVATFHAMIPADEAAFIIDELGREYNNALLAPERNQPGHSVITKLKDLEYPNLYYQKENSPGWWTSGGENTTSRGAILHELREPLTKRQIVIYEPEIIKEHMTFIQPKDDVPQAARGMQDDWVMAMAITWQMRKHMHTHATTFKTYIRKETTY